MKISEEEMESLCLLMLAIVMDVCCNNASNLRLSFVIITLYIIIIIIYIKNNIIMGLIGCLEMRE